MKKEIYAGFAGAFMFVIGFAMSTGIEEIFDVQTLLCIMCFAASYVLLRYADRAEEKETTMSAHKAAQKSSTVA